MEVAMALQLGDVAPDFEADSTEGRIKFHDYINNSWVVFMNSTSATPSFSAYRSIPSRIISAGRTTSRK
jgi:hypothetical protein